MKVKGLDLPLSEIITLQKGKKPNNQSAEMRIGFVPNIDIKAFEQGIYEYYTDGIGCVPCEEGDVLVVCDGARSGMVGRARKGVVGSTLAKIVAPSYIDKRFLFYFLQWHYKELNTKMKGTGTPHIDPLLLGSFSFPIISDNEQRRIVAKIDALFSKLDKGVETLQTIRQQLRTYRQAVLKWAFEGRLTNTLFEKKYKLEELCFFITKGTTPTKAEMSGAQGVIPFIKVYNLSFDGALDFSIDPTFVTQETHNGFLARSKVLPNDVLMNIVGPPMGKVSIVPDKYSEWNINQAIARFRCKDELYNKYLAYYLLNSDTINKISRKAKATAGQFNLTLEICRNIEIPFCSINKQQSIVAAIESRLSVCDKLEQLVSENLAKAAALRQSILKKAFAGQLVPQDPNDEPADKLLERIQQKKKSANYANCTKGKRR